MNVGDIEFYAIADLRFISQLVYSLLAAFQSTLYGGHIFIEQCDADRGG